MSMFSVDINSAGGANYIRPKKGASGKRVATPQTPIDMTKNGSLFNDPNIFSDVKPTTLNTLRTSTRTAGASLTRAPRGGNSVFGNRMNFISGGDAGNGGSGGVNTLPTDIEGFVVNPKPTRSSGGDDDLGIGRNASKGRAAAKALKKESSDLKSQISGVENSGDEAGRVGKRTKKLNGQLQKTDAKFKETQAKQKAEFEALEAERRATIRTMSNASRSIDDYSRELEYELASGNRNEARIASLRSQIREQNSTLQIGNQKVNVIGRESRALVSDMNRTSKAYVKTSKAHQKKLDKTQEELQRTLETAAKIEGISTIIETTGAIIENLGIIFKACAAIPFVGAALAAAGAVMEPIGATGKAVGQWGKFAAQVTQTVAYASAGMVQQAFMSAASALQTGASAIQSTKQAVGDWGKVGSELKEVKADAADAKSKRMDAKAAKDNKKAGVDADGNKLDKDGNILKDKDGNAINVGKTEAQQKADASRLNANEKRLDANYAKAKLELKQAGLSKEDYQKQLDSLNTEYTQAKASFDPNVKPENLSTSKLLKGTSLDKGKLAEKFQYESNNVTKKVESKSKKLLKTIFSNAGLAVVCQSLTLAGMIVGMSEANKANKGHNCSDFEISARAQKIVAKTMSRMGYTSPGAIKVHNR